MDISAMKFLEDRDWDHGPDLVCPGCRITYPWMWDEQDEFWWPDYADWWYTKKHGFICSRSCYLKLVDDEVEEDNDLAP